MGSFFADEMFFLTSAFYKKQPIPCSPNQLNRLDGMGTGSAEGVELVRK
ncbi:hypothetical protein LEWO105114_09360 [Legionella worsleiensis]|nr:Uncharacterised protein [Legionella worsleiensis]